MSVDAIEPIPHDEIACEFCRLLNELKAHYYATLTRAFMVPAGLLDQRPDTASQEYPHA